MAWKYRFVIAACARWEAPYAAEWLAYHRAIGFEHVYLYCNDDDPAALYEAVLPFTQGPDPFVTFRFFPEQGMHRKMMLHFCAHNGNDSEWVSFLDLDEFLRLPPGQTLPDYMRAFEDKTDCLMFNWVFFGPNGQTAPPKSVLKTLTRRSADIHPFTKMLFRSWVLGQPELFKNVTDNSFVHRLHQYVSADIRPMNVLGEDMADYYIGFANRAVEWLQQNQRMQRIFAAGALVHHYVARTEGAFADRAARGLGGDFSAEVAWARMAADKASLGGFLAHVHKEEDTALSEVWDCLVKQAAGMEVEPVSDPPKISPVPPSAPLSGETACPPAQVRLGIAITTLNRRDMVMDLVTKIRALTAAPFDLVICDDGSSDGTVEALRERGEVVIGGTNRGIAWNKNRGIYYLMHSSRCEVVLLIDDDVAPVRHGWEREWITAAQIHGHVNYAHPVFDSRITMGGKTAENPGMCSMISGCALVFDRYVLAQVGFMDPRFGRYGHEHTELTFRVIRAGYGAAIIQLPDGNHHLFKVIEGGLKALASDSLGSQAEAQANDRVMAAVKHDMLYRHAWRDDEAQAKFLAEQDEALPAPGQKRPYNKNLFPSLEAYQRFRQEQGIDPADASLAFLLGDALPSLIEETLAKGQRLVVVEPDARLYYALTEQFAAEIAEGRLVVENFAPAPRGGEIALLQPGDGSRPYPVATISWEELVAKHGRPARVHMGTAIPGFPAMAG